MRGKERFIAPGKRLDIELCALALASKDPGLKPILRDKALFRWTEVQLPLLKQGAPTRHTSYCLAAILRMVLVVLTPSTVGTISTRPPQVLISSAPTMVELV